VERSASVDCALNLVPRFVPRWVPEQSRFEAFQGFLAKMQKNGVTP